MTNCKGCPMVATIVSDGNPCSPYAYYTCNLGFNITQKNGTIIGSSDCKAELIIITFKDKAGLIEFRPDRYMRMK